MTLQLAPVKPAGHEQEYLIDVELMVEFWLQLALFKQRLDGWTSEFRFFWKNFFIDFFISIDASLCDASNGTCYNLIRASVKKLWGLS